MQNYREAHRAKSPVGIADAPHRPPRAHAQKIWLNQIRTLPIAVLHEQSAECRLQPTQLGRARQRKSEGQPRWPPRARARGAQGLLPFDVWYRGSDRRAADAAHHVGGAAATRTKLSVRGQAQSQTTAEVRWTHVETLRGDAGILRIVLARLPHPAL